jgi:hypothetical protein
VGENRRWAETARQNGVPIALAEADQRTPGRGLCGAALGMSQERRPLGSRGAHGSRVVSGRGCNGLPRWSEGTQRWLLLPEPSRKPRPARSNLSQPDEQRRVFVGGPEAHMLVNSSIGYRGQFVIVAVPKGSTWSLTISVWPLGGG